MRDWDKVKLSQSQIYYSTNEVRACIELFKHFAHKLKILGRSYARINSSTLQNIIQQILESDHLLKVCISPENDIRTFSQLWAIEAKNFFDVRFLATKCGYRPECLVKMLRNAMSRCNLTFQRHEIRCHAKAAIKLLDRITVQTENLIGIIDENSCRKIMQQINEYVDGIEFSNETHTFSYL